MGADSVLINAAFKEAASRAGADVPNMKPLYDSTASIGNKVFGAINSAMDKYVAKKEIGRAGVRKQMVGFQKDADALVSGMYAQDEPLHDVFINAFRGKIASLQDEFELYNTYGKGDTSENSMARARIMGELKRVTNQAKNFRSGTEISLDALKDVDPGSVDGRNIAAYAQAFNFADYDQLVADGKISVEYGKNGIEITTNNYDRENSSFSGMMPKDGKFATAGGYSGENVTVTLASFKENFEPINIEGHISLLEDYNNSTKVAIDEGGKLNPENTYNEEEYNALFTSHVDTEDKFKNFATSKIKGVHEIKESFKVSLEKELSIPLTMLSSMYFDDNGDGINDMDVLVEQLNIAGSKEDDGIIDAGDIAAGQGDSAFEQNLDALIDALTNVHHPAFDIGLSAPMLGAYLGKINKGRYDTAFNKTKKASDKSTPLADQQSIVLGTYMSWESQDMVLDAATNGEAIYDWKTSNEWMPDPDKPGNYRHSISGDVLKGNGESYPLDKLLKGTQFGMSERIKQRKLDYGSGLPDLEALEKKEAEKKEAEKKEVEVKITEVKDGGVVSANLNPLGIGFNTDVKKINGKFHKQTGYAPNKKWVVVSAKELARINKSFK